MSTRDLAFGGELYRETGDRLGVACDAGNLALRILTSFGIKGFFVTQLNSRGTLYLDIGAPEEALGHFRAAA